MTGSAKKKEDGSDNSQTGIIKRGKNNDANSISSFARLAG
jgi:hypothetical protein